MKEEKLDIPSRLYLDCTLALKLDQVFGRDKFMLFLENHLVITMDSECYKFLLSIKADYEKTIKKRYE